MKQTILELIKKRDILDLTKKLRHNLIIIIPDTGSKETIPEQILLNALISYDSKRK